VTASSGVLTLALPGVTPPSFNAVGYTGNRWALTRAVKMWKQRLEQELMVARLPLRCAHVHADARLVFPKPRTRDAENYRVVLSKALGDALTGDRRAWPEGHYLPDDDERYFTFGRVEFAHEPRERRTEIVLTYTR